MANQTTKQFRPGTVLHTLGIAREELKRHPIAFSPSAPKRAIQYEEPENKFISVDWESGVELIPGTKTHFALRVKNDTKSKHVSNERHSLLVDKALKPKLLTAMEEHLYNEMRYVKPDDFNGRIRVVRETFTMFVEQFEVYKDVLTFIRNEYDKVILMIAEYSEDIKLLKEKLSLQELGQSELYNNAMDRAAKEKAELIEESAQYRHRAEKRTQEMHSFRILLSQKDAKIEDLKAAINDQNILIERTDSDLEKYKKKYEEVLRQLELVNEDFVKFRDRSLIEQQGTLANYTQACEELRQSKRKLQDYEAGNSEIVKDLTRKLEELKLRSVMYENALKKSKKSMQDVLQENKRLKLLAQGYRG